MIDRFARLGAAGVLMISIAGCGPSTEDAEQMLASMKPQWRKLDDGSLFASVAVSERRYSAAVRCWIETKDYLCLDAGSYENTGITQVDIERRPDLPTLLYGGPAQKSGYSCGSYSGYQEEISRDGNTLISNTVDGETPRWSRRFVAKYMAANGVKGISWYRCLEILQAIKQGSFETLTTTSITKPMITEGLEK
jgi:hypothetical protein